MFVLYQGAAATDRHEKSRFDRFRLVLAGPNWRSSHGLGMPVAYVTGLILVPILDETAQVARSADRAIFDKIQPPDEQSTYSLASAILEQPRRHFDHRQHEHKNANHSKVSLASPRLAHSNR